MNQKPTQSSFDSDGEQTVSSERAIPLSNTSADETPGFGSDAKRQKVEEEDEKVKGGDGDVSVEAEDDGTDEIEDEDDDFVEVNQYSPKVMTWNRCSEDDEGYQRYVKKIVDSQGFDLDEDPRQEYLFPGFGVCKVYFEDPQHAHHKEYVRKCITEAIKQQSEPVC
ncbi:unnamed protein product [Linum tenue]|uniref:Uncharacterized protein n=1 Tax=Linum tenue TaxID=586396 RepID=A0AAV0R897_9ROSI|nr:unnamed protein product [Linum tenue]